MINELATGLRQKLRDAGLTVVPATADQADHSVTLTLNLVNANDDADGNNGLRDNLSGPVDIRATVLLRASIKGDTEWIGVTSETVMGAVGTLRNVTIGGVPVSWVQYQYSADLGSSDKGRPEASDNYMIRASRPAL